MAGGFIVSAPSSGSGKTILTLALLRAFKNKGVVSGSLKLGPDYIDPQFHRLASGGDARHYDVWSMRDETLNEQVAALGEIADIIVAEAAMGMFDGPIDGTGSAADASLKLGWPVILVVDVKGQAQSAAALVEGFDRHRTDVKISGVIFNRVGSDRHAAMLDKAMERSNISILGHIPTTPALEMPSRHLGLVQAEELQSIEKQIQSAADLVADVVDLEKLSSLAVRNNASVQTKETVAPPLPVLGSRIAVAQDQACRFVYHHILDGWQHSGAEIINFSPLADDEVPEDADAVYLPGGYPELHAERLSTNKRFRKSLAAAAVRNAVIYGECGGFMMLGETLTDGDGIEYTMAGLLPIRTSFANRRLHLGYRNMTLIEDGPLGVAGTAYKGHEFHYATLAQSGGATLFEATDAQGENLQSVGAVSGTVAGSFMHIVDKAAC